MTKSRNYRRVAAAYSALDRARASNDDLQDDVCDLLTNLMHLCADRPAADFDAALAAARRHFEVEA